MNTLIQFALAAGSITGLWIVAKNPVMGWRWCAIMEIPWTIWAVSVDAWGFMVLCWVYGGIYSRNLWQANKAEKVEWPPRMCAECKTVLLDIEEGPFCWIHAEKRKWNAKPTPQCDENCSPCAANGACHKHQLCY